MPRLSVRLGADKLHIDFEGRPLLSDLLRQQGLPLATPCGGKGICGKCGVLLQQEGEDLPRRLLACQTRLQGSAQLWLPEAEQLEQIELNRELHMQQGKPMPGRYGLALDIGSTTMAARLVDLSAARPLSAAACRNPQRSVADNVIGRIEAAMAGQGHELQRMVREAADGLLHKACGSAGIRPDLVDKLVVAGNTTMLTLWAGRDVTPLSKAPFHAEWLAGEWDEARRTYLAPCIEAFLGADILLAVLSTGITKRSETALLADIGTNGELALWHAGRLYCCATAAGPAFEGGGIRDGLGSVAGAVDAVWVEEGELRYSTIAGAPARGICGSGLVDAAAALLALGVLDETGALEGEAVEIAPQAALTRQDIRSLQLAKGAVAAGIATLCGKLGIGYDQIQRFYIAGGFGAHLRPESAAAIGLFPAAMKEKALAVGNAALAGALMLLMDEALVQEAEALARQAQVVQLSGDPAFAQAFVDGMMFEEMG